MNSRPIVDKETGNLSGSPDTSGHVWSAGSTEAERNPSDVRFPGEDGGRSLAEMAQRDLTATLQLLAERAQFITEATGAAIALRDQDEMVCRASAGSSAPTVGTLLRVNSGLSGESVRTRETLRCDDAFTDPRVNRESCEALGIRSVVVMPLLRGDEVIGVFELFSDQANIFQTRDLIALERMGAMVHTALEHSTAALGLPPMLGEVIQAARGGEAAPTVTHHSKTPDSEPAGSTSAPGSPPPEPPSTVAAARAGVVFHSNSPAPRLSSSAEASAPVGMSSASAKELPSKAAGTQSTDDDDILEQDAPTPGLARTEVRAAEARTSFESLVARADQESILSDRGMGSAHVENPRPSRAWTGHPAVARDAPRGALATPVAKSEVDDVPPPSLAVPRAAVANLKKCASCGFPVSEGRQLCLDCEKKNTSAGTSPAKLPAPGPSAPINHPAPEEMTSAAPHFMIREREGSWLSTHKFTVVALVLAAIGIVAVVLLR